jgi:hypothetical protein
MLYLRTLAECQGGSASPEDDGLDKSPKAQISGGKAASLSQRIEYNAFQLRN